MQSTIPKVNASSIINIENLYARYGKIEVLHNISCDIEMGDFIGLVGPNGAGKTTLAKVILGLVTNFSGKVIINTGDKCQKSIGYLPQETSKITTMFPISVEDVVSLGLLCKKKFPRRIVPQDKASLNDILEALEISRLKHKMFSELSGGQRQKVLLARTLIANPQILILDEPSTALDPDSRKGFFEMIKRINQDNRTTVIMITHDTGYIGNYANKLLYIDVKLIFFGKINDFCSFHNTDFCLDKDRHHLIWHNHN